MYKESGKEAKACARTSSLRLRLCLRLTSIGIVKMFIMTVNVILPELETVVTVANSLYSTVL